MHEAAHAFIAEWAPSVPRGAGVIEAGSCDRNGTVRALFPQAGIYLGLDVADGPGVDVVADAVSWVPPWLAHAVVSTETLEHVSDWRAMVTNMGTWLRPAGMLLVTCAGPRRKPHAADGSKGGPPPGEHYENVDPRELAAVLRFAGFRHSTVLLVRDEMDVQAVAFR